MGVAVEVEAGEIRVASAARSVEISPIRAVVGDLG
jgi:hypothetical protein